VRSYADSRLRRCGRDCAASAPITLAAHSDAAFDRRFVVRPTKPHRTAGLAGPSCGPGPDWSDAPRSWEDAF
jgi:hypothetical protein